MKPKAYIEKYTLDDKSSQRILMKGYSMSEFTKSGGAWLAAARSWIQWNCVNGSGVTWGSDEILQCKRNFTPALVEEIAATAVNAAFPEVDKLNDKIRVLREKLLKAQMGLGG